MKIGIGFDVHAFRPGKKLIIGGVGIKYCLGLEGHSDADVLIHSIMDALLGAAGLGDIGVHFPNSDGKYKGISSLILLEEVKNKIGNCGLKIINLDSVLILEEPKISGYIPEMIKKIADVLEIDVKQINIKATTSEGLGYCGRKEGAASQSIALLEER
ncbi:MAG: 2-C-methyl-D-erythritol 2,4-cyclodiphosphate synthase [Actinobacteria bacterium]|nr:2-C-methyl-D-erythritol 2,4-cyclodiphosphate synthase [Actinomycetota bacterium]MBM3712418.1 2-C-methyl-D-erythritol 2,4-cyclodiphosphate synthase [Actinomycetota bacterium]